jgi:hypothetical protein
VIVRVHAKHVDRRAADGRPSNNDDAAPLKMIIPAVNAWIEQNCHQTCRRIDAREIRALVEVAVDARESKIIGVACTAVLSRNNVLDMESG